MRLRTGQDGITLLITLLLTGVLLSISASLLSITLKQYQLSGLVVASEKAFQAANAAMECGLFHDLPVSGASPYDVPLTGEQSGAPRTMTCMGVADTSDARSNSTYIDGSAPNGLAINGGEQLFQFEWGGVCTEVSVYKFIEGTAVTIGSGDQPLWDPTVSDPTDPANECPAGSTCTVVRARGYNVPCGDIGTSARAVERELAQVY